MNESTLLHRQINPSFVQAGFPTSQAFKPTPKDDNKLSVYDADLITAENAWNHFTAGGLASDGSMSVSVVECNEIGLEAQSDPVPYPEHAIVDFETRTENQCRTLSKKLRSKAVDRGWTYKQVS